MKLFTAFVLMWLALPVFAQDSPEAPVQSSSESQTVGSRLQSEDFFGLGLQTGLATGTGITIRYSNDSRLGGEVTLGLFALNRSYISLGGEIHYMLSNSSKYRFYALGGMSGNFVSNDGANLLNSPIRLGIGAGYEWFLSNSLTFGVELPFTIFLDSPISVLPLPQFQLMFYFQ